MDSQEIGRSVKSSISLTAPIGAVSGSREKQKPLQILSHMLQNSVEVGKSINLNRQLLIVLIVQRLLY